MVRIVIKYEFNLIAWHYPINIKDQVHITLNKMQILRMVDEKFAVL